MACQRACSTGACGNGNRLPEDVYIFETVDAEGRPAEPGTQSQRVLVTNLSNHTHPLIRVKVTDEVCVIDRACPCGSSTRLLDDPQGLLDDIFVYECALSVHPHLFRSALRSVSNESYEHRVRQTTRGAAIAFVTASTIDPGLLHHNIVDGVGAPVSKIRT